MQTCTKCEQQKPVDAFHRNQARCKLCRAEAARAYRVVGGAALLARGRESQCRYAMRHREQVLARKRAWAKDAYARNREAWIATVVRYTRAHPEVKWSSNRNYGAKRRGAEGKVSNAVWRQILRFYGHACGICRRLASETKLTTDHYQPIDAGGPHDWMNVWPLCRTCNRAKGRRLPAEPHPPHAVAFVADCLLGAL